MKKITLILYIFLAFNCFGGSKTLDLESLFKKSELVYSTDPQEEKQKKLAEKAAAKANLARRQSEERNAITVIEININWWFISFYYFSIVFILVFYFWVQKKKKP